MPNEQNPSSLLVRTASPQDIPAIHAIHAWSVIHDTASWAYEPPAETEMLERLKELQDGGYPYLVAEVDGIVAGYAYASAYRPRIGYRFLVENSVYVAQNFQRRGIGQRLLTELIRQCEEQGFRQMIAVIGDSDNLPSIALHRSLGFEQVGLLPNIGFKHGRWLDSVLMQRALGNGANSRPK
ncbi:GNAT family N-acetyltransferase [Chloroflexi bacterium TSY]|nr:GNAT family N-acetyltransferase [Chloroflexi bacterium TSY]